MKYYTWFLWCCLWLMWQTSYAQTRLRYEYWFNNNAQQRNISLIAPNAQGEVSFPIPIITLPLGLNTVHIRFIKNDTSRSAISSYLFYRSNDTINSEISGGQYWFDDNFNQAQTFLTTGQSIVQNIGIDAISLGLHKFNVRFRGAAGYSSVSTYLFYKTYQNANDSLAYWWHNDLQTRQSVTLPATDSVTTQIPLYQPLCDGWYYLNIQFFRNKQWSSAIRDSVYLTANVNIATTLVHTTCGLSNGTINITPPNAGTLQYALNNGSFQSAPLFNNLNSGNYTVKIKDATGCQISKPLIINASIAARIVDTTLTVCNNFQLGDTVLTTSGTYRRTLRSFAQCDSFVTVRLTVQGVRRDTFPMLTICDNGIARDSVYADTTRSRQGCDSVIKIIRLRIMSPLSPTLTALPTCNSRNSGSAMLRFNRARTQIGIRWSTNDTALIINGLAKGNYAVTVTDSLCHNQIVQTVEVLQTHTVNAFVNTTRACKDRDNGTAIVIGTSGNRPFRYAWSDSSRMDSFANRLKSGNYKVTVTDTQN
ncbi:MAG: hypothetical protein RLZZ628_3354, partial [Bacteroidota bacterium]